MKLLKMSKVSQAVVYVLLMTAGISLAQAQRADGAYNPGTTVSFSVAGTAPSAHIIQSLALGRELVYASASFDWTVHQGRKVRYRWEAEVIPLAYMSDPRDVLDLHYVPEGAPPYSIHSDTLDPTACSSTRYDYNYVVLPTGSNTPQYGTVTGTRVCSTQWTYAGGISPLGQRVNWRPTRRVQPYALINAGFLAFARQVPVSQGTQFNFTVEGGAGVEIFQTAKRSAALDITFHHTSNADRGAVNPGIDQVLFRLSYRLGR